MIRWLTILIFMLAAGSAWASPPEGVSYWAGPWVLNASAEIGNYYAAPEGTVGNLDFRPSSPTDRVGFFAVVGTTQTQALAADPDYLLLGTDLYGEPEPGAVAALEAELGLTAGALESGTLMGVVAEVLTEDADGTGQARALPLIPTVAGDLEIHLGGHSLVWSRAFEGEKDASWGQVQKVIQANYASRRAEARAAAKELRDAQRGRPAKEREALEARAKKVETLHSRYLSTQASKLGVRWEELIPAGLPKEAPEKPETTVSDDFNRADGDLGGDWVEITSYTGWTVASNRARSMGDSRARLNLDLSSDDNYAEMEIYNGAVGPMCRVNGSAVAGNTLNAYMGYRGATKIDIYRISAGGLTDLGDLIGSFVAGVVTRISADGSSVSVSYGGGAAATVTDTGVTGGLQGGIFSGGVSRDADNFLAADLVAAASPVPRIQYYNRLLRGAWLERALPGAEYLAMVGGSYN